jgi:hypothetical protein
VRGGDSGGQHLHGKGCPKPGRDLWRREIVAAGTTYSRPTTAKSNAKAPARARPILRQGRKSRRDAGATNGISPIRLMWWQVGAQRFDLALRDLRMKRPAGRFTRAPPPRIAEISPARLIWDMPLTSLRKLKWGGAHPRNSEQEGAWRGV